MLMRSLFSLVTLCFVFAMSQTALAASPSVESVSPGVGQHGTTFQLKLIGAGLANASEVMLYSPGVTCESLKAASDNELIVQLKATIDCSLGSHAFRIRTPKGISE